jgi:ATP-binding cassette subfamily B protein
MRHKWSYGLGVLLLIVTTWMSVKIPIYIGRCVDLMVEGLSENYSEFTHIIFTLIWLALAMVVVRTASRVFFFNPGRAIERDVKNTALAKITKMQKPFFDSHDNGTLISIVNNDINGIRALCGIVMLQIFQITFALSLTPLYMWRLSPSLTLYCIIPVVISFYIAHRAVDYLRKNARKRMEELQELSSGTVSFLSGAEVIKANGMESWASSEFDQYNQTLKKRSLGLTRVTTLVMPVINYTDRFMKALILAVGGLYVIKSSLTIGELTALLSYSALLARPFISLGRIYSAFQLGLASIESIRRILDSPGNQQDDTHLNDAEQSALFSSSLQVKNLSYRYTDSEHDALSNISFTIRPGEKLGVLGQVGSGKTTLVNCLNRYLEVDAGTIFIDGTDVTQISRSDLRSAVRTVTQEPFLFSDSVESNIQFGSSKIDDTLTLEDSLYQSAMQDEVARFPNGEQTVVGEKGILLSGGQKQRLSLARAMFTPSKLIVLDNVLSAVDNETERFLLDQIFHHLRAQSTLIVTHRASVLEKVDRILVLDAGKIVAEGNHDTLLSTSELYKQTWEIQQQGGLN